MYDYQNELRRVILMIDSKSFYASVEAVRLKLNPLKAILVVTSTEKNTGSGLVLAASPMAKKLFGISNVTRARDVPIHDKRLIIEPPKMNLYIQVNQKINRIFSNLRQKKIFNRIPLMNRYLMSRIVGNSLERRRTKSHVKFSWL